jgi:hypothetical protein
VVTPKLLNKTVFLPDFARHSAMYDLEPTELVMDLYAGGAKAALDLNTFPATIKVLNMFPR